MAILFLGVPVVPVASPESRALRHSTGVTFQSPSFDQPSSPREAVATVSRNVPEAEQGCCLWAWLGAQGGQLCLQQGWQLLCPQLELGSSAFHSEDLLASVVRVT